MPNFLKSDLTYSLSGGFILGALMLFFMQPTEDHQDFSHDLSSTVSVTAQVLS
tara:strand:+ start:532 stop:690 length:159 start_codon:yes stop_codon:yes gene_type:complete